jgi:hypothetical protein
MVLTELISDHQWKRSFEQVAWNLAYKTTESPEIPSDYGVILDMICRKTPLCHCGGIELYPLALCIYPYEL